MELRFEPCMLNLIWERCTKEPRKREDHLIFINFRVKKFIVKKSQKYKILMFEYYNLLTPME
jgi:hypothetical protein